MARTLGRPRSAEIDAALRRAVLKVLADLRGNPALAQRLDAVFIRAENDLVGELVSRAERGRGELARCPDPSDLRAQLLGTVFAWVFLIGGPPDHAPERLTAAILAATVPYRSDAGR